MYLENIFIGSEDIRKQLPQESQMFDGVHANFMRQMKSLHATGNCLKACTAQGLLESFQVGPQLLALTTCSVFRVRYPLRQSHAQPGCDAKGCFLWCFRYVGM